MKNLIHILLAVLPAAAFADHWVESGRADTPVVAVAVAVTNPPTAVVITNEIAVTVTNIQVGGGAADNLGDHQATGELNMASFAITNAGPVTILGGGMSGGYALRAVYGGPSAWDMIQLAGGSPYDEVALWPWNASDGDVLEYNALYDAWVPAAPDAPVSGASVTITGAPELATAFMPQEFHLWNVGYSSGVLEVYTQAFDAVTARAYWRYDSGVATYAIRPARMVQEDQISGYGGPGPYITWPTNACWLWGSENPALSPGFPAGWCMDPAGMGEWTYNGGPDGMYVSNLVSCIRTVTVAGVDLHFINGAFVEAAAAP